VTAWPGRAGSGFFAYFLELIGLTAATDERQTMPDTREFTLTDAERDVLPSAADVSHFAAHGWYLSEKLLNDDEVDALLAASERFYGGERDRTLPVRPPNLAYWEPGHGPVQRHNDYIHYESTEIGKILRKPLIGAVAARLAQADEIRVFQATLIFIPFHDCGMEMGTITMVDGSNR
jgi:hypothetical protein